MKRAKKKERGRLISRAKYQPENGPKKNLRWWPKKRNKIRHRAQERGGKVGLCEGWCELHINIWKLGKKSTELRGGGKVKKISPGEKGKDGDVGARKKF